MGPIRENFEQDRSISRSLWRPQFTAFAHGLLPWYHSIRTHRHTCTAYRQPLLYSDDIGPSGKVSCSYEDRIAPTEIQLGAAICSCVYGIRKPPKKLADIHTKGLHTILEQIQSRFSPMITCSVDCSMAEQAAKVPAIVVSHDVLFQSLVNHGRLSPRRRYIPAFCIIDFPQSHILARRS